MLIDGPKIKDRFYDHNTVNEIEAWAEEDIRSMGDTFENNFIKSPNVKSKLKPAEELYESDDGKP